MKCKIVGAFNFQNIGNQTAPSTYVDFYLSDTSSYDPNDSAIKTVSTGKLRVGKSRTIRFSYNLTLGQSTSNKFVIAVIDKDDLIAETNKSNNIIVYGPIP